MSAPFVIPSAGQNGLRRLVSRTSRRETVSVTLSVSVGIRAIAVLATSLLRRPCTCCAAARQNPADRSELGRALAVARCAGHRGVIELQTGEDTPQHEAAAAHVAATDERGRKHEAVTKNRLKHLDVFSRG